MEEIAPGSILQRMYLKKRLKSGEYNSFCEIGSGNGYISEIFLKNGLRGIGIDLNKEACANNQQKNKTYIESGSYKVVNGDFLEESLNDKFDYIFSSMVIEHLSPDKVSLYLKKCKQNLNPKGKIAVFVPGSMKYWGIEDEIVGHYKRYEFDDFKNLASQHALKIENISGLTFPVSNWLFSLSNYLVNKKENYKKELHKKEQTILSGNRNVKYKTSFPPVFKLILNEWIMYPFYVLQRVFKNHPHSMVIYCEMSVK